MYAIGCLAVTALVLFLIYSLSQSRDDAAEKNRELIRKVGDSSDFDEFWKANRHLSEKQALLKFYANNEEKKKEAIARAKILDEGIKKSEELRKREDTIKRVFAYKYEKFIYWLYSPFASFSNSFDGGKWSYFCDTLPKKYVLTKIKEEYNLSDSETISLYKQFIENQLLKEDYYNKDDIEMGYILGYNANVVCDEDLNIDKYIRQHGQRCSENELKAEILQMIK